MLKSVEIFEGALGPSHPELAEGLDNLAGVLGCQVKMMHISGVMLDLLYTLMYAYDSSGGTLCSGLPGFMLTENSSHACSPVTRRYDWSFLVTTKNNYDQANPLYQRVLPMLEKAYGPDHEKVTAALNNWAGLLTQQVKHVSRTWSFGNWFQACVWQEDDL